MKKKLAKRLMCILLSGMLFASSVEMPLYASEGGEIREEESSQQEIPSEEETILTEEETVIAEQQTEETFVSDMKETTEDAISTEWSTEEETAQSDSLAEQESSVEQEDKDTPETSAFPTYSEFVINLLYKDILDEREIISEDASLQSGKDVNVQSDAALETFQNAQQAADYVRSQMVERSDTIMFYVPTSLITSNDAFSALVKDIVTKATAYTENCSGQEGDALQWVYGGYGIKSAYDPDTQNYLLTYTMTYYTTQEQEIELTQKVNNALESLKLQEKTDYQKIKLIHNYICDNVDYDYTYSKYSAYDALCTGTAVCQGYAVLFYRMCKEAGLSVRVIPGIGNGGPHAWNIIRLGVNYYNVDCTWDGQDETTRHTYFLLNDADFVDHTRDEAYATDAFYADYPMAAVSYVDESEFDEPFNQENPNVSFTTLDDETVSSVANGKPKLIIFFKVGCYNSQSTISSIAKDDAFPDVDVYAIEINKNDKDAVSAFKNSYGSDDIVFSYDISSGNNNGLWNYMRAAGLVSGNSFSVTLPVICYIDANNQLQYITQGLSSASAIKSNLVYYCNATVPVETYNITYVLNGGTNNSANPTTYQSTSGTIMLQDPVREGYVFAGWYIDPAYIIQITQIDKGNSGDITLYANWEKNTSSETEYSITYILNGGTNDSGNPTTYRVDSDTIILRSPTRKGYTFVGWYRDSEFTDAITQILSGSTGDITLYAKWKSNVQEEEPSDGNISQVDMTLTEGNILMGFSGTYYTETAEKILNRLNQIRLEACKEGVINPNTNLPLTEADYVPLQWSADLEAITRMRAAEATVAQSHTRPNGKSCFSVKTTNGQQSWAENLAWNNSGLMEGIEQWYREKGDWVNKTGKTTGHYTSIINPQYRQVAVAAFRLTSGGWYAVAQEFGYGSPANTKKDSSSGKCVQYMEVQGSAVTSLKLDKTADSYLEKGDTMQLSLNATITHKDYYGESKTFTGPVKEGGTWSSSDESVASVDTKGLITAKQSGTTTITVTAGTASATVKVVVYEPQELIEYTVSYDVQGHGTAPANDRVKVGAVITPPQAPTEKGYVFEGWYQDAACTIPWNFDTNFVQKDTVLYAKWLIANGTQDGFHIQEIADVVYTGKPCKPAVSVYDGETLLKLNKDYTLSYYNNTNVNATKKTNSGVADDFKETLPYVKIIGKGNYTNDDLSVNFNILPAALADEQGNPSKGVTLQYTEQTVANDKKPITPFRSVKYGKAMKLDEDYQISLKIINAFDQTGNSVAKGTVLEQGIIPTGYTGSFALTVTGMGNYTGALQKNVYVADKDHLLKNAKITLGEQLKSINCKDYTGAFIPAYFDKEAKKYYLVKGGKVTTEETDAATVYTVSCGNVGLIYGQDFDVIYENDHGAGKAQMTIIGKGAYAGTKSAPFQLIGTKLSAASVVVTLKNKIYTGKALTQNEAALILKDSENSVPLRYGSDYTIVYKKNIDKGKASMTFTAVQGSAYSGSFTKTFQIEAADLSDTVQVTQSDSMSNIVAEYEKAGAKPSDRVTLTNAAGIRLQSGKDYTISYVNNTSVTKTGDSQSATMIITGKGNYAGTLEIPFTIVEGVLDKAQITITPVAYNTKKDSSFEYKPSVKLKLQNSALNAKTDYEVTYRKNTQADYEAYLEKLKNVTATEAEADRPMVVISAKEGSNYVLANSSKPIEIPLPIYQTKLTKKNLYVVVEDAVYTGKQVTPNVSVYYSEDPDAVKAANSLTNEKEILKSGFEKLTPDADYTLSYGTNIAAGKNKGSVKISGTAPFYGGDITIKFTIHSKKITW